MSSIAHPNTIQHATLPWEITDAIIDHLHSDLRTLGICSFVCSEWLIRSRHHIFSTVQLWPWRVRRFFDLASERECTFTNHVSRIEVDDSRARSRSRSPERDIATPNSNSNLGDEDEILFNEAMSQPHIPCLAQVESIEIRNVDWTTFSLAEQTVLRRRLAKFSKLDRLEFHGVTFHDLREVVRIVDSFPLLHHLTANITFTKYFEHTIASAATLRMSNNLRNLELGTDEGIPVMLTCMTSRDGPQHVQELKLKNIEASHLQYIRSMLRKSGKNLQHLGLGFAPEELSWMGQDDLTNALDLSRLSDLRTLYIEGLNLTKVECSSIVEETLPYILARIESSFLESVELKFRLDPEADLHCISWRHLEPVLLTLHFFSGEFVRIIVEILPGGSLENKHATEVERAIYEGMAALHSRGVLDVRVIQQIKVGDETEGHYCSFDAVS